MEKIYKVCDKCGDKHCCRGLCKEMNDYLVNKNKKSFIKDSKSSKIK